MIHLNVYCIDINDGQSKTDPIVELINNGSDDEILHEFALSGFKKLGLARVKPQSNLTNIKLDLDKYDLTRIDPGTLISITDHTKLKQFLITFVKRDVCVDRPSYPKGSFEEWYFQFKLDKFTQVENNSPHNDWARSVLAYLPHLKDDDLKVTFPNPFYGKNKVNTSVLTVIRLLWKGTLPQQNVQSYGCTKWDEPNNRPIWEALTALDDVSHLQLFMTKRSTMRKFLSYCEETDLMLGENYSTFKDDLEQEIIDIKKDQIYVKYMDVFQNNSSHISVLESGKLVPDYKREENIFGLTPDDYLINRIIHEYCIHQSDPANEECITRLQSLRESLLAIDFSVPITQADASSCNNPELAKVLAMI